MWRATLINGDSEVSLKFTSYADMTDYIQACFQTDEYANIRVAVDIFEERRETEEVNRYD